MFLKLNKLKVVIFVILVVLGIFSYWFAMSHIMDCFMQSFCQRPISYYLIAPVDFVVLTLVIFLVQGISLLINPFESINLLVFIYIIVGIIYYYLLSCIIYTLITELLNKGKSKKFIKK